MMENNVRRIYPSISIYLKGVLCMENCDTLSTTYGSRVLKTIALWCASGFHRGESREFSFAYSLSETLLQITRNRTAFARPKPNHQFLVVVTLIRFLRYSMCVVLFLISQTMYWTFPSSVTVSTDICVYCGIICRNVSLIVSSQKILHEIFSNFVGLKGNSFREDCFVKCSWACWMFFKANTMNMREAKGNN